MSTPLVYTTALAALITCLPGCSLLITHSGTVLRDLDSRQIVHDRFGPPDSITEVELIDPRSDEVRRFDVENYHVHAKFNTAVPMGSWVPGMVLVEPFLTVGALYEATREIIEGHHLAFVYDEQGNTIGQQYPRPFLEAMHLDSRGVLNWRESRGDEDREARTEKELGPGLF